MACRPQLSPPCLTALPITRISATARRIGVLPCKDEPQASLPRIAMLAARYGERSQTATPKRAAKRPNPHSTRCFCPDALTQPKLRPPARRPAALLVGGITHLSRLSRPRLIARGMGLFMRETPTIHRPRMRAKAPWDGSPQGRNCEAGSVHDSPARGACPVRAPNKMQS